ncbi:hypothetical protein HYU15_02565, partial [Candidatus Woesearchaeota archaeon]|nr:hypothetical protein [Candidatus Woesearchaeota archaeon]
MYTSQLDLGGRVLHLASHSPIETSGLPDGARLIELQGGSAFINRQGGIEVLPPRQPAPVSPVSSAVSEPRYEEGHVRTGYILPLGLAAVIAAGMALVALTGTLAQITRGILPNNTPPVIAAQQGS